MSKKKESSIEFFNSKVLSNCVVDHLHNVISIDIDTYKNILQEAKKLHKQEIEEAHYDGSIITLLKPDDDMIKQSEQYYKETFGDD